MNIFYKLKDEENERMKIKHGSIKSKKRRLNTFHSNLNLMHTFFENLFKILKR